VKLAPDATWTGVDPTLRDAVTKASIQLNEDLYVSATTNGTHAPRSYHYNGLAIDISRVNGKKFITLAPQIAQGIGNVTLSFIPEGRWREFIGPDFAFQFNASSIWSADTRRHLILEHRSHVHIAIAGN